MSQAMSDLEKFINYEDAMAPLIRAALVHYQFETIHPFLDGNGRVGRMLILLCLMEWGLLHSPVLYVSYFLKKNQWEYYGKLETVRTSGNYEQWILFFLEAVRHAATDATENIKILRSLLQRDSSLVHALRTNRENSQRLFNHLVSHPIVTVRSIKEALNIGRNTSQRCIGELVDLGILHETTNQARNRIFSYEAYLSVLRKDT
jgi:Fic family protein